MKLIRLPLLLLPLLLLSAGASQALPITLTLDPSAVALDPGESLLVDVVIGGLDDDGEIALESFDLDLAFDGTRLTFVSLTFGASLGDPNDAGETFVTGPGDPNVNGVVELGTFSLLTEAQLLALQIAPFVLATIEFTTLENPGPALLEFINLAATSLGAPGGELLGDDLTAPSALQVTIVPEPALALLLLGGLAGIAGRLRRPRA